MEPVTVTWNGDQHVQSATEIPAGGLTAGEYLAEIVVAHGVPGDAHEFVMLDGEPVPADLDVTLLSGLTVRVRTTAAPAPKVKSRAKKVKSRAKKPSEEGT